MDELVYLSGQIGAILFLIIIVFVFTIINKERRSKFFAVLKKKKTWRNIAIAVISPVLFYTVVTLILFVVRGDSFAAYYVYIGENKFIYYNDSYYIQLVEEEQVKEMDENEEERWYYDEEIVVDEPVKFPYFEYWVPTIMCDTIWYRADKQYISVSQALSGHSEHYQLVEE